MRNVSSCAPCYRLHRKRCLCLWDYACQVCPFSLMLFHLTITAFWSVRTWDSLIHHRSTALLWGKEPKEDY